ncbi:amino acid permease [Methylocystis sp. IM3]|jgi:AAT family amino acid transporter|uniref:amino acid permease n=1 Tax=unclassified Methylocystis TaxID=2625913 RepID=UPI000F98EAAF|nr:MAG: amino acid permease [Hyphomicrobiales bacterium]
MNGEHEGFKRSLGVRQMRLLALGSTIGVGLFLGSASAIKVAGPSIILAYLVAGVMTFFILRALGEMAIHHPVTGSFAAYASLYVSPFLGYLVGWGYWFYWTIIAIAEVTAVGIYMQYWFPGSGQWIWAFSAIAIMGTVNLFTARVFGEFEFWFALIKVATILIMIGLGLFVILFGFPGEWAPVGVSNLTKFGGFFPAGIAGCLLSMQMVVYAYVGVEMIGIAAGEAEKPQTTIPMAINSFVWRIIIFYVGALFVILAIFPWNRIGLDGSPFVQVFQRMGLERAAGLVNFVVVTAALSSCNGGIFSSGRILYTLAEAHQAPAWFGRIARNGIPIRAMVMTVAFLFLGAGLNYFTPAQAFEYLTAAVTFIGILIWLSILYTHVCFRRRLAEEGQSLPSFAAPFWPVSSLIAAAFLIGVVGILIVAPDTRIPVLIGLLLLCLIAAAFRFTPGQRAQAARISAAPPSAPV